MAKTINEPKTQRAKLWAKDCSHPTWHRYLTSRTGSRTDHLGNKVVGVIHTFLCEVTKQERTWGFDRMADEPETEE